MSTLPIRALHLPQIWPPSGFKRVVALVSAVLDVIDEAKQQAAKARARYPFAD